MNNVFIHYGSTTYFPNKVKPVKNLPWRLSKPTGGFWVSPINSKYDWKSWCLFQDFNVNYLTKSLNIKFKKDAKVFKINDIKDIERLPTIICYEIKYVDYEKVSETWDALWLTSRGVNTVLWKTYPSPLHGWDCESVLILNSNSIYQI
jgi:hypothetical protein